MPRVKGRVKYYVIISKERDYTYGAFPFSASGLKLATAYLKTLSKRTSEKYKIQEA